MNNDTSVQLFYRNINFRQYLSITLQNIKALVIFTRKLTKYCYLLFRDIYISAFGRETQNMGIIPV